MKSFSDSYTLAPFAGKRSKDTVPYVAFCDYYFDNTNENDDPFETELREMYVPLSGC